MNTQELTLAAIKHYPAQLKLITECGKVLTLNYDNQQGEFTREEWSEDDDIVSQFDEESKEEILNALDNTSNVDFFRQE